MPKNCSPIDPRDCSQVPRGTPSAWVGGWRFAPNLQDRLQRIYGDTNPNYVLRLAQRSRTYQDLIRRYSNDSML